MLLCVVLGIILNAFFSDSAKAKEKIMVDQGADYFDSDDFGWEIKIPEYGDLSLVIASEPGAIITVSIPEIGYRKTINFSSDESLTISFPQKVHSGYYTLSICSNGFDYVEYWLYLLPDDGPVESRPYKVKLNKTSKSISVGERFDLEATITPNDDNLDVDDGDWESSNEKVATVDSIGKVIGVSLGEATISYTLDGITTKCKIKVTKKSINAWVNDSVKLSKFVKNIKKYKNGTWKSSKPSVVEVDKTGKIKIKKAGKATITFTVGDIEYKFKIYGYKKETLKTELDTLLNYSLKNPASFICHEMQYEKADDYSMVYLGYDYSATNSFGGYVRDVIIYYYHDGEPDFYQE